MGNFILDFYCSKLRLAIEIDGNIHNNKKEYDEERTNTLSTFNIKVIRYSNHEIQNNLTKVDLNLRKEIRLREKELGFII
jgi:very-short-patch-repair endonuclease